MTRYLCDRCNKEVSVSSALANLHVDDKENRTYNKELCASCVDDLIRFMDGKEVCTVMRKT